MLAGINWEATIELADAVSIPVIASGGLASIADIVRMTMPDAQKLEGAISGRALYDGRIDPAEALAILRGGRRQAAAMKLSIILAPYDSGHWHEGFGQGPDAIIAGGLVDELALRGHDVVVEEIGKVGDAQTTRDRDRLCRLQGGRDQGRRQRATTGGFRSCWPAIA